MHDQICRSLVSFLAYSGLLPKAYLPLPLGKLFCGRISIMRQTLCAGLQELCLNSCTQLSHQSLAHLTRASHLSKLDLSQCKWVEDRDLIVLQGYTQLRELSLVCCTAITNKGALQHPVHLANISFQRIAPCSVCTFVTRSPKSRWRLKYGSHCTAGIRALAQNSALVSLDLGCLPELDDTGIAALSSVAGLRHLKLDRCPLIRQAFTLPHFILHALRLHNASVR